MTAIRVMKSGSFVTNSLPRVPTITAVGGVHGRFHGVHDTGPYAAGATAMTKVFAPQTFTVGQVFNDTIFYGQIRPSAANVEFHRCIFVAQPNDVGFDGSAADGWLIEDSLVDGGKGGSRTSVNFLGGTGTVRRTEVRGGSDVTHLVATGKTALWEDCWIHSPVLQPGSHSDVCQFLSGTATLKRCRIEMNPWSRMPAPWDTAAPNGSIQIGALIANATLVVQDCYLDGSDTYTLNANFSGPGTWSFTFNRNRFGRAARYGYVAPSYGTDPSVTWGTGADANVFDDTGEVVPVGLLRGASGINQGYLP